MAHSLYKAHSFLASGGAVERVAAIRRPGPVAIPDAGAVGRAFSLALAIYAVVGLGFGFTHKSPQAIALGAILIFGVAYMLAQGFADAAPRALDPAHGRLRRRPTSVSYFALQVVAVWLTSGALPADAGAGAAAMGADRARGHQFRPRRHRPGDVPALGLPPGRRRACACTSPTASTPTRCSTGCCAAGVCATQPDLLGAPKNDECRDLKLAGRLALDAAADRAARAIPPVWPLASSVAVNPFLGQTDESLATVGARLARVAGIAVTMPRSWYQERIASGVITDADLSEALASAPAALRPANLAALKSAADVSTPAASALPTIADLAAEVSGIDWPGLISERFGAWAAGYFDEGQALWAAPRGSGAYAAWRAVATHDLTPEIAGLPWVQGGHDSTSSKTVRSARLFPSTNTSLPTPPRGRYSTTPRCRHTLIAIPPIMPSPLP